MSYTVPNGDSVLFALSSYTVPSGDDVLFELNANTNIKKVAGALQANIGKIMVDFTSVGKMAGINNV